MKSYTDLEQSKKLAEILPIESADMYYIAKPDSTNSNMIPSDICIPSKTYLDGQAYGEFCAWSLAALLGVLPNNEHITTTLSRGGWKIEPVEYIDKWFCEYENEVDDKDFTVSADNPIGACYKMILKLHEQKLL